MPNVLELCLKFDSCSSNLIFKVKVELELVGFSNPISTSPSSNLHLENHSLKRGGTKDPPY